MLTLGLVGACAPGPADVLADDEAGALDDDAEDVDEGLDDGLDDGRDLDGEGALDVPDALDLEPADAVGADEDPAAPLAAAPPGIEALFSFPTTGPDRTLEDKIVSLLGQAAPGSKVRISIYHLTRTRAAQAIVDARARGVDVKIVVDKSVRDDPANLAWPILVDGLPAEARIVCARNSNGGCIGTNINHSKIFLFERLVDGTEHVVVQSSANLTGSQLKQFNNMVVIRGDAALFDAYLAYWNDLKAQRKDPGYYRTMLGHHIRAYAFPRDDGDNILGVLDRVVCHTGSELLLTMAFFGDSRLEVAQKLAAKKREGCKVKALLRQTPDEAAAPGTRVLSTLRDAGIPVTLFPKGDGVFTIHSKTLLVDSDYRGDNGVTHRKLVFTGSHNYTANALENNDEVLIRVDDPDVFAAYRANWTAMRATKP